VEIRMTGTESLIRNAKVLLRAERIAADIQVRHLVARSGVQLVAGLVGLFGLVMLGVAAFLALEQRYGPIAAATIVGAAAVFIAGVMFLIASRMSPGRDLELAHTLRDQAGEALLADVRSVEGNVLGLAKMIRNPLDGALPGLIVPLAGILLKSLRKSPADPSKS
jgi:hypothetical protein